MYSLIKSNTSFFKNILSANIYYVNINNESKFQVITKLGEYNLRTRFELYI